MINNFHITWRFICCAEQDSSAIFIIWSNPKFVIQSVMTFHDLSWNCLIFAFLEQLFGMNGHIRETSTNLFHFQRFLLNIHVYFNGENLKKIAHLLILDNTYFGINSNPLVHPSFLLSFHNHTRHFSR